MRMHLKGIKAYQSKGRVYYYHCATKTRIKAEVGTPLSSCARLSG